MPKFELEGTGLCYVCVRLVKMADKARCEGLLTLEEDARKVEGPFLRRGQGEV